MSSTPQNRLRHARLLIDDYAERTGLSGTSGDPSRRYLWTDAFAVQTCFALARALEAPAYHDMALKLIALVHETLGRFHPDEERKGWISGLPDDEARKHPTAGGLRIGKKLPERKKGEPVDERLEWERDGQYFHYLTRWFNALLLAAEETGEQHYAAWAAELMEAAGKFIYKDGSRPRMYWKMDTALSRPLVPSMGAHDPLEGLTCTFSAQMKVPVMEPRLQPLLQDFRRMCSGRDWATSDALGIGGLLLNTLRVAILADEKAELPAPIHPQKLWDDSLQSLLLHDGRHRRQAPTEGRLPFRECGLSLGLRALHGGRRFLEKAGIGSGPLEAHLPLAGAIENFWLEEKNRRSPTWKEHLDINAVTFAASVVAEEEPLVFG